LCAHSTVHGAKGICGYSEEKTRYSMSVAHAVQEKMSPIYMNK